jgi:hypothetical protein
MMTRPLGHFGIHRRSDADHVASKFPPFGFHPGRHTKLGHCLNAIYAGLTWPYPGQPSLPQGACRRRNRGLLVSARLRPHCTFLRDIGHAASAERSGYQVEPWCTPPDPRRSASTRLGSNAFSRCLIRWQLVFLFPNPLGVPVRALGRWSALSLLFRAEVGV